MKGFIAIYHKCDVGVISSMVNGIGTIQIIVILLNLISKLGKHFLCKNIIAFYKMLKSIFLLRVLLSGKSETFF